MKILFAFSLGVPTIVSTYGLDMRLAWVPVLFYAFWILFIAYYKPKRVFSDYPERSLIERIRGWMYVFSLAITLSVNWLLLTIIPKTVITFLVGTAVVGFLLMLVVRMLPRGIFRKELTFMSKYDEMQILFVLRESGIASIQFSISILLINLEFFSSNELSIVNALLTLIISLGLFAYAFSREKKSSKLASDFAIELKNSNWYNKYSYDQRRKKRKRKS